MLDSMTNIMEESVNNKSNSEVSVEHVGAALLNGLGNLLDITSHEAKDDTSGEELPPVPITYERREKVRATNSILSIRFILCYIIIRNPSLIIAMLRKKKLPCQFYSGHCMRIYLLF